MKLVLIFLLLSSPCYAQATRLDPSTLAWKDIGAANTLSNIAVGLSIATETYHSYKDVDRKRAFIKQGERTALILGVTEIVKRVVHRSRPDNSDDKSFYSEHTAFGSNLYFSIPIGYLRIAANKHYLTDTIVGAAVGSLTRKYIK